MAAPGGAITYTLIYTNAGAGLATGVVISDRVPIEITGAAFTSTGAAITQRQGAEAFEWDVEDLAPGTEGVITVTGVLDLAIADQWVITNTAMITTSLEVRPLDNLAAAICTVSVQPRQAVMWLPLVWRP